ncbi:MAG: amino acid adenylation domain-containing protein [Acidothermaceae bacterium]
MEFVRAAATAQPDAIAVEHGDQRLTYSALIEKARAIATRLRTLGVCTGDVVAISADRSIDLIAGVVGILEAGAGYLPLDPTYPPDRLRFMLDDAKPAALVTQAALGTAAPQFAGAVLLLEQVTPAPAGAEMDAPLVDSDPERVAYVIYTSGSTGRPKGVIMPHRPLCNLLDWQLTEFAAPARARTLQFASLSFDVGFQDTFATLAAGGTLVIVDEIRRRDPDQLLDLIASAGVERLFLPFVALEQIAEAASRRPELSLRLREVITAGEALQVTSAIRGLFAGAPSGSQLVNQYGPTESHVVTSYTLNGDPAAWPDRPPIGHAIQKAVIEICDEAGRPVVPGEPGELCIGGPVLAHGYLNRPELTAERFIEREGERYYRTGDQVRVRDDGEIDFIGRADDQVKVRGYRVELGEIEAVLSRDDSVGAAVCTVQREAATDATLVAYVTAAGTEPVDTARVRAMVARELPAYMVPSRIIVLERFPLTPSGKIDRKSLPAVAAEAPDQQRRQRQGVPPRTPTERKLAEIWREILNVPDIGIHDNFFELGATSLAAARLFARIEQDLGTKLPIAPVFQAPTIEALAKLVDQGSAARDTRWRSLVPIKTSGSRQPLFGIHGGYGTILHFHPLSQFLDPEQPFYGLQQRGLYGDSTPQGRVEEMAATYLEELRDVQPQGPYHLLGYCFGGLVAFEMAHQLRRAGEEVAFLGAINGPSADYLRDVYYQRKQVHDDDEINNGEAPATTIHRSALRRFLGAQKRALLRKRRRWLYSSIRRLHMNVPERVRDDFFGWSNHWAEQAYRPEKFAGRLVLFEGTGLYADDPTLGWIPVVDNLIVEELPGDHMTNRDVMREPFVKDLATTLQRYLDA